MKHKFKIVALLFVLSPILLSVDDFMSRNEAEKFADNIYVKMREVANTGKETLAESDFDDMYGYMNNVAMHRGKDYPNPVFYLLYIEGKKWENVKPLAKPKSLFLNIARFSEEHSDVKMNYVMLSGGYRDNPKMFKNEDPLYYACVFRQEWHIDGKPPQYLYDSVLIDVKHRNIGEIVMSLTPFPNSSKKNNSSGNVRTRKNDSPSNTNSVITSVSTDVRLEESDMMVKAVELYDQKKYPEAMCQYKKITDRYPKNDEAWYSLGVMFFKGQGVENLSKKQRMKEAYDCWKKSNLKKACRAISYITDGREGC